MIKSNATPVLFFSLMLITGMLSAQDFSVSGQAILMGTGVRLNMDNLYQYGIRYFPRFNFDYSFDNDNLLNAELFLNAYCLKKFYGSGTGLDLYRIIARYTTAQSETQIGLQKINFGPAQLLRPLMWFDRVDPRDPLKMTNGVYGIRYKYSFLNNSLIWLWSLYGNNRTKGFEVYQSADLIPEFGGRLQTPVPAGELAASFHTRNANTGAFQYRENRFALDGKWDIEAGFWFESVFQNNRSDKLSYRWDRMITAGADYTFPIGSGLYLLCEYMTVGESKSISRKSRSSDVSALLISYPLDILDQLILILYAIPKQKTIYQYIQWQRIYDNVILNAGIFHYPENTGNQILNSENIPTGGYGMQLTVMVNY